MANNHSTVSVYLPNNDNILIIYAEMHSLQEQGKKQWPIFCQTNQYECFWEQINIYIQMNMMNLVFVLIDFSL